MTELSAPTPSRARNLTVGPKMRQAWEYVLANPGCTDYVVKINFDRRLLARLVKAKMIEVRSDGCGVSRCYALHGWQTDITLRPTSADSAHHRARTRVYADARTASLACIELGCLAPVGTPCTGPTMYGHARRGPHYSRLINVLNKIYDEQDQQGQISDQVS